MSSHNRAALMPLPSAVEPQHVVQFVRGPVIERLIPPLKPSCGLCSQFYVQVHTGLKNDIRRLQANQVFATVPHAVIFPYFHFATRRLSNFAPARVGINLSLSLCLKRLSPPFLSCSKPSVASRFCTTHHFFFFLFFCRP